MFAMLALVPKNPSPIFACWNWRMFLVPAFGFKLKKLLQPAIDWWFWNARGMFTICRLNSFSHWPIRNIFEFSDSLVRTFSRWWCQISTHASFSGCSGKILCRLGYVNVRKVTVINILKSRRGEDSTSGVYTFPLGLLLWKRIFHPLPSWRIF